MAVERNSSPLLLFYGRRKGRKLRPKAQEALEEGLASYAIKESLVNKAKPKNLNPRDFFDGDVESLCLEIGFGGGEHLAARASIEQNTGFIGAEPYVNGVARLCSLIAEHNLKNIRIWHEDVRLLLPKFTDNCLAMVFILFPDPWQKKRHRSRRIVQPEMLTELARLIKPQGRLLLASDDPSAKSWILQTMLDCSDFAWQATSPSDWRKVPSDVPQATRYMAKAKREGRNASWFDFKRL